VDRATAERLGGALTSWGDVDAIGLLLLGAAWLRGSIRDDDVLAWARSDDR
jgi:hypothetical protein